MKTKQVTNKPTNQHKKVQTLRAERDHYKDAYENMRAFAKEKGLDTTTRNLPIR